MYYLLAIDLDGQRFYYAGYTTQGPTLVQEQEQAFRFPDKEHAINVLQGDARFNGGVVLETR